MVYSETVEIRGHILDSGTFARVLDDVLEYSGDYRIEKLDVGRTHTDESYVKLTVLNDDHEQLDRIVMRLQTHGANKIDPGTALLRPAPHDGVFPDDFYSTTNLDTKVRVEGTWIKVVNPEMDCGIVIDGEIARTIPVSDVRAGEQIVCGINGVKVTPLPEPERGDPSESSFEFMTSEVSSEKPQALLVRQVAEKMRDVKARGEKILWVGGPAIVHTGAAPALVALIEEGYVDVLFAGNALATHDIESALYGTSLGVDLDKGHGVPHGHEHHIRAINRIRAAGSIADAVSEGVLRSGVMHAMVNKGKQFVLVGSVRDDGPLPDVYTDVIDGQRAMRRALDGVGFAIMVATMLHSIATGNMLPATVPLVSVDINPATVTKLADRGSAQATGVITDIGLFCEQLASELVVGYKRD
ncbi:TIGR00300 family protein [Stackebrandtia nassauensis]|uniref:ornithine cyclodeaminase n=1 Tax=Stackebrandtia nassauensis (strain DSM 44728 / CIP 108903 / NRRL B-16338 / NBRC 102104 / LLR-40K-21) TaxID=446470 RepID=D3Q8R3_STANL|nr:TIGR00300 family protein [Stackebrandtia nassauensis]ADD44505.1 LOR/SDH bifunctional protein conserved domain protein [Stackebrandtia nassauensis DSM 44728]